MTSSTSRRAACGALLACTVALATAANAPAQTPSMLDYAAMLQPAPASVSESQLDDAVAMYTYEGQVVQVSSRDVIEDASSLEARVNPDGTYRTPTAEEILVFVRNQIQNDLVAKAGIEVDQAEVEAYMAANFGSTDVATVASYYGLDPEKAERILTEAAAVMKLRDQVAGAVPAAPVGPEQPADGDVNSLSEGYAAYILSVAGEAWDQQTSGWVAGSLFDQAMAPYAFDGSLASYDMALAAYYAACNVYSASLNEQFAVWSEYLNSYLAEATITILTLRS